MKFKFLLFTFLLWGGVINAQIYHHQDTVKSLVITEYRGDNTHQAYLELTNMGNEPIQLGQFKIGSWGGGSRLNYVTMKTEEDNDRWIPLDKMLAPGESYVFAPVELEDARRFALGQENVSEKVTQDKMAEYADYQVHIDTAADGTFADPFSEQWGPGMNGFYIEQHFAYGTGENITYDSIVVDQVLGMFTGVDGVQLNRVDGVGYDIAGVTLGTATCYLIRKNSIKKGNLDFNNARGVGIDDSEWIPIPHHGGAWRSPMWTVGNQGNYNLDANTLESDIIDVDFANKTLTVPWGIQRGDDIMNYFVKKPGVGWEYIMGAQADSLTHACQTGDQLLVYVCGDNLDLQAFDIIVKEPAANASMVVPVSNLDPEGSWREQIDNGSWDWPRITQHNSGNDTIWGVRGGIPYATRVDSLLERLEKPSNAEWEIVYASGIKKPDLSKDDKLMVTAQDGSTKEYYIAVNEYRANTDASLSSITWPDIPEFYKGIFGWIGDTIPGFSPQVFNYNVEVPLMATGMPALVAKTTDINATIKVDRATSLSGSTENRTVDFTVTAEDDTTVYNYGVTLTKEKNPANLQPNFAEPFISEVINNVYWINDGYVEIVNPGNQPLDLSDYMIIGSTSPNPADAIAATNADNWLSRYDKYIPGYKWESQADWVIQPYIATYDVSVNSIVQPGDVFVLGATPKGNTGFCGEGYSWPAVTQVDVQFMNADAICYTIQNPWGESVGNRATPCNKFRNAQIYLFKILNDSVKQGLKPATDPTDFDLIDVFGMGDGSNWAIAGVNTNPTPDFRRKPEIYKGNPMPGISMGVISPDDVEWDWWNHNTWANLGFGWPDRMTNLLQDLGKHYMYPPTDFMSTVSSLVYKVSEGYSLNEQIKGVTTGTSVANFLDNIIKANPAQILTLTNGTDGTVLGMADLLKLNDILTVLSADSTNTTKYVLEVTDQGLSSDAILTSTRYDISIDVQPKGGTNELTAGSGTIKGFEYGTQLKTVLSNIVVPAGASLTMIDGVGAYVPLTRLNFDTTYITVTVNSNVYFDVVAENGTTRITYQLVPQSSTSDAFLLSDVYKVSQKELLINFVPRGTNVQNFMSNLVESYGASLKLVDKMGFERTDGIVADDDKVVVTSADGTKTVVYYISKLQTQYIQGTTYLAYILSKTYMIDQVGYIIDGTSNSTTLADFYSKITPATGATAVVVDKDKIEKTNGNITGSDMVKVTSADGRIEVFYTFGHVVSANAPYASQIELYPNPSSGKLNLTGLEAGQRIQVYNAFGSAVIDINADSNHKIINLDRHPAGMYIIVISNNNQSIGKYKAVKY